MIPNEQSRTEERCPCGETITVTSLNERVLIVEHSGWPACYRFNAGLSVTDFLASIRAERKLR